MDNKNDPNGLRFLYWYVGIVSVLIPLSLFTHESLLFIATLPWSLFAGMVFSDLSMAGIIALPVYLFNAILIYWLVSRRQAAAPAINEIRKVATIISGGYVAWSVGILYYTSICSGKFCEIAMIISLWFTPGIFLIGGVNDPLSNTGLVYLTILINLLLIYFLSIGFIKLLSAPKRRATS
jgi:hypothetical protein